MSKLAVLFGFAAVAAAVMLCPNPGFAQNNTAGIGSALDNNPMMHQGMVRPGIDDVAASAEKERPQVIIKDVKKGMQDADPKVRVSELVKLRALQDPEVTGILLQGMQDRDVRVKVKAIDVLGARETTDAVPQMSQLLSLRTTPDFVKIHLVAALGRIGDSRGALPVMQYLQESTDSRARGTAVFALGEMSDPRASQLLTQVVGTDDSPMVRRLAQESLEKIDGELPTEHQAEVAAATAAKNAKHYEPTDQKLQRIRELDQKMQEQER